LTFNEKDDMMSFDKWLDDLTDSINEKKEPEKKEECGQQF
jgi:hypothetical protein